MARADESLGRLLDLPVKPDQPLDRYGNAITLAIDGTVTAALVEALGWAGQAPPVPSKGQDAGPSVQAPNRYDPFAYVSIDAFRRKLRRSDSLMCRFRVPTQGNERRCSCEAALVFNSCHHTFAEQTGKEG